jgi:hypothetical protein
LFEDDFEFMDVSWGDPDEDFFVEDGALVVKTWREHVNFSTLNEGANVCVDITIAEAPNPDYSPVGLIFWWQDWDNYYYLWYWADGGLEVRRIFKGQSSTVFTTATLALKKGVGETNNIELRLKPKDATVNGTEVKRFKGIQPKDGGVVGITASSPDDAPGFSSSTTSSSARLDRLHSKRRMIKAAAGAGSGLEIFLRMALSARRATQPNAFSPFS